MPDRRPRSIRIHLIRGGALVKLHRVDEAIAAVQRALVVGEHVFGPDHPDLAVSLDVLGFTLMEAGGRELDALAAFRRALDIKLRALGPDHPTLVVDYQGIGNLLLDLRRHAEAIDPLERGLQLTHAGAAEHTAPIDLRLRLTDALWSSGRDRPRARTLAAEARTPAGKLVDGDPLQLRTQSDRWLADHPDPAHDSTP